MTPPLSSDSPPLPVPAARLAPPPPVPAVVPERRGVVSILSDVGRRGEWTLARLFRTLSIMGNVELDLTRARIAPGASELEIRCVMGSVTVRVPPGVRLECSASPVVGTVTMRDESGTEPAPDAPLLRITGSAFMGAIEVVVVDPTAERSRGRFRPRLPGRHH